MSSTEKEGALYHACQSRRYSSFSSSVHPTLEGNRRIATARATIAWLLAFPPRKLTRFYMEGLKWKAHFGLYMSLSHNKTDMPLPYICTIPSKQHRWYLTKQIASDKKKPSYPPVKNGNPIRAACIWSVDILCWEDHHYTQHTQQEQRRSRPAHFLLGPALDIRLLRCAL